MPKEITRVPGLVLTDHEFDVPLNYAQPQDEQITVFAREVVAVDKQEADLPWLVFFQGGPGYASPRPMEKSGWLKRAVKEYRVLLPDQRGTGRSSPVLPQTLARFETPQKQADYLVNFRVNNIIKDVETIRQALAGSNAKWSVMGQSYGGFCILHYLSVAPESLNEAFITGGIPPVGVHLDDVYRATYKRVIQKNREFYERYPEDVSRVKKVVEFLQKNTVELPGGGILSTRRFRQLGIMFGMSDGFATLHYLLENAFVKGLSGMELSYAFLRGVENHQHFETNPIYAILHEAIYSDQYATNWSAERCLAEFSEFSKDSDLFYFTGEMVYSWMFEDFAQLAPLREAALLLAEYDRWPFLYDEARLKVNTVPCAAAVYYNDMYVEREFSERTAAMIPNMKIWITNEYEHNGLRADGEKILDRLIGMVRGDIF